MNKISIFEFNNHNEIFDYNKVLIIESNITTCLKSFSKYILERRIYDVLQVKELI